MGVLNTAEDNKLSAAIGSTARAEVTPMARQAIDRAKAGRMFPGDFAKLYGADVRAGVIEGENRHANKRGFSPWKKPGHYLKTLTEK